MIDFHDYTADELQELIASAQKELTELKEAKAKALWKDVRNSIEAYLEECGRIDINGGDFLLQGKYVDLEEVGKIYTD